ncbi:diacylglycerol kinase family lipid kinase [Clostridiaceae bacterium]|nr:diacylglycerol kinase family lipid kinase [Clostridiaceae bacterium]RKI08524.1 diacylglycerol kinase family lipid kinase [bacterium 1XD21-70]
MYYFIVNPSANRGHGEKVWRNLEYRLKRSKVEYEVLMTQASGDALMFASRLQEERQDPCVIVAVGGDGTVNEVLNGVSFGEPVTLGYIPAGAGNDLARSLKLPRSPRRCLKRILNSRYYRWLDYGVLSYENGAPVHRRFAISCGLGLDAAVCQSLLERQGRKRRGPKISGRLTYLLPGLWQLLWAKPVKGYLMLDGIKKIEFNHIYFISAQIHPHEGGGFRFAPKADGSDGLLEICVVHNSSKSGLLPVIVDALLGKTGRHRGVRFYSCKEAGIHVDRPMPVHTDGENCYYQTDIHLRCIEKTIRMIV